MIFKGMTLELMTSERWDGKSRMMLVSNENKAQLVLESAIFRTIVGYTESDYSINGEVVWHTDTGETFAKCFEIPYMNDMFYRCIQYQSIPIGHDISMLAGTSDTFILCQYDKNTHNFWDGSKFYSLDEFKSITPYKIRRATNIELAQWLARGNGILQTVADNAFSGEDTMARVQSTAHTFADDCENVECDNNIRIRKWCDHDWHEPTSDYMEIDTGDNLEPWSNV